jgi:signal transduction histidine kinase
VTALAPRDDAEASTGGVWLAVIVLSLVAVAVAIALALLQARRLAGPMERLARRAGSIGHADGTPEPGDSGIAEVERIESSLAVADARIAEALRHEREFSANVSHQLRSPLTGLRMRLEELSGLAGDDAALAQEVEAALAQSDRLMEVIAHLEELAGSRDGQPELLDLAALASEHVGAEWHQRYASAGRVLTVDPAGGVSARTDPEAARQLIDVLLDNALAHGAGATHVAVAARAGAARLRVQDEGRGIDAAKVERLFERHFSSGNGGVGLAVARDLARRQGGDLRLASARPACFEALLPGARRA